MSRWTEFLATYNYRLVYWPGKQLSHTDALSRCPLPTMAQDPTPSSRADLITTQVLDWVRRGWPLGKVAAEFQPFKQWQLELTVLRGCLLWGDLIMLPPTLCSQVLGHLHLDHPGIVHMKALAHSYVWCPKLDNAITAEWQIAAHARSPGRHLPCDSQELETAQGALVQNPCGPFHSQTFLVVVNAFSKWVELVLMVSTTTGATIRGLQRIFATHSLPDTLASDNGPQFTAARFQAFLASLRIRHALMAPYHLACNAQVKELSAQPRRP